METRYESACPEEAEDVNMVQLHAATQTEAQPQVQHVGLDVEIYGLGRDYILLDDVSSDIRSIAIQLERIWEIPQEDIETLHEVRDPPLHRQRGATPIFLLEMRVDRNSRGRTDDVMVFSEVIVKGDVINQDRMGRVLVLWMRRRARRIQILSQLRLDGLCDSEDTFECKVFYNNALWPEADYALRQLSDGDAIWVDIQMRFG